MFPTDYAIENIKGIKKSFDNGVNANIETFMELPIVNMYTTSDTFSIFTSTEGMTGTKQLGDFETPPSSKLEDGYSVTITEDRYGNGFDLSERTFLRDGRDNTTKVPEFLIRQRTSLWKDVRYKLIHDMHLFLNDAFTGTFLLGPDGQPAADAAHTWNTVGASTFDNTSTLALDSGAIDAMELYAGAFVGPDGKKKPINFGDIVVKKGSANAREAKRLFASQITPTAVADVNIYEGEYRIIETPHIDDGLQWFAFDKMEDNPFVLEIGEPPTMREPIRLINESIRTNVTGFWKKGIVNIPFAFYASTGVA